MNTLPCLSAVPLWLLSECRIGRSEILIHQTSERACTERERVREKERDRERENISTNDQNMVW